MLAGTIPSPGLVEKPYVSDELVGVVR